MKALLPHCGVYFDVYFYNYKLVSDWRA